MGKTLIRQKKAVTTRQKWSKKGIHVPPFMILSITNKCNLKCKGCYASIHHHHSQEKEMILAITYIILLAAVHVMVPEEKKIWSLIALSIGILYSVMASVNYNIQTVAVRLSLACGETGGIEMLIPDNPNSIFKALSNSYVYMALLMFFLGFIFTGAEERWIKGLLLARLITAKDRQVKSCLI